MDLRDTISEIIRERAFIAARIARKAGLTPMQLGQSLRKARRLDTNEFLRICEALEMSPEAVISYSSAKAGAVREKVTENG